MKISNNECIELGVVAIITPQYYFKIMKKIYLFISCSWVFCFHVCLCITCVQCPRKSQRALDSWDRS